MCALFSDLVDTVQSDETVQKFMSRVRRMQQETTGYFQGEAVATTGSRPSLYDKIMRRDEVQAGIEYMTSRVKNVSVHAYISYETMSII